MSKKQTKNSYEDFFSCFMFFFFFCFSASANLRLPSKQNSHYYLSALFDFVMYIDAACVTVKQFALILSVDANNLPESCENRGSRIKYVELLL